MRRFSKLQFAKFVRGTREKKRLSMRQTARKSGLTLARVFAIENGEARLSVPQLLSLAAAFDFKSGSAFLWRYERTLKGGEKQKPKKRVEPEEPVDIVDREFDRAERATA